MSRTEQKSKSKQRLRLSEEQIREYRAQVEKTAKDDYYRTCAEVAELFEASGLTKHQLAEVAGICEGTAKNFLGAKLKGFHPNTLRRIHSALLAITSDNQTNKAEINGYSAIWLDGFRSYYCSELLRSSFFWKRDRLPYFSLHSSKLATDIYQSEIFNGSYGDWIHKARQDVNQAVSFIHHYIDGPFDLICLTVGHGWNEFKLAQALWLDEKCRLRDIYLICPDINLLDYGVSIFTKKLNVPDRAKCTLKIIIGTHESYLNTVSRRWPRKRAFLLFGTLMNHDSVNDILCDISRQSCPGDVLIFDAHMPYADENNKTAIMDRDPRLCGILPLSYVKAAENIFEPALRQADASILHLIWSYEIEKQSQSQQRLESYSVSMNAKLIREHQNEQEISVLRIHRHSPIALEEYLREHKWTMVGRFIQGQLPDVNYPTYVYVFFRH